MRRSWIIAALIAVVATAWIMSGQIGESNVTNGQEATEQAAPERPVPQVRVERRSAEPMVNTLILQGRTLADRKVEVRAETVGLIEEILVERGATVAAGDVLVRISVDDRQARLDEANAMLQQRQIEFDAAAQLNERGYRADTQLAQSRAALDAARADVEVARLALDYLTIRAPFAGRVEDRYVEIGAYMDRGDPVAMIVDLDPLRIAGQVSERYLGQTPLGSQGTARLVDGRVVDGIVSYVGIVAHPLTRTYAVELEIANPDGRVIEGLTAELELPIAEVMAHRVSPAVLSLADNGEVGVKAVDDANRVVFHPVEILGGTEDSIWLGGLPDTLTMIVVGQEFVQPGQIVRPVTVEEIDAPEGTS